MPPRTYERRGTQQPYDEDATYYRDRDPQYYAGSDGVDSNVLRPKDVPGGTRKG